MINTVETLGLRVESISPEPYMINVNVNSEITIKFNSDLNTSTIVGNFTILHDTGMLYVGEDSLKNFSNFTQVQGSVSYKDKSIIFTPTTPLEKDSRYIVCIRENGIKDILSRTMLNGYTTMFYTELHVTLPGCDFTSPAFGTVAMEAPEFHWADQKSKCYVLQISKEPTFETIICEELVRNTSLISDAEPHYTPANIDFNEGIYYTRVRSLSGVWGESLQFFIKHSTDTLVSADDTPEGILLGDAIEEIEVLEMFPHDGGVNMDVKVNIMYVKVRGFIAANNINFNECFVVGELVDEDDLETVNPQGYLTGIWNVVYDKDEDVTYIIFTPNAI